MGGHTAPPFVCEWRSCAELCMMVQKLQPAAQTGDVVLQLPLQEMGRRLQELNEHTNDLTAQLQSGG